MNSFTSLKYKVAGVFTEQWTYKVNSQKRRTEEGMENSPEEQRREETYHLYSPCYFFEQVVKAFLKCLGHDSTPEQATISPSEAERGMKITEEFEVQSTRSIRVSRRPPTPPISSGGGGQINSASS